MFDFHFMFYRFDVCMIFLHMRKFAHGSTRTCILKVLHIKQNVKGFRLTTITVVARSIVHVGPYNGPDRYNDRLTELTNFDANIPIATRGIRPLCILYHISTIIVIFFSICAKYDKILWRHSRFV